MLQPFPHQKLKTWFLEEKRDLPWRHDPSPYAVWVSEVMLQQTQVAVVLPYFLRWMQAFPTVEALAQAPLDQVIKLWEGLGYYSRARNLHGGAQYVVQHFGGQLPQDPIQLMQIKGLGPYTVGAICSFAFHQKAAAVDGNVIRVLSRYYAIENDVSKPKTIKQIWEHAKALLPDAEPWIINEALIELGATVCQRKAKCHECPISSQCQALQQGKVDRLPFKTSTVKAETLYRTVAVIRHHNAFLVRRGTAGKVMADLHEFPYFETGIGGMGQEELAQKIAQEWSLTVTPHQVFAEVKHSFTRFYVFLNPILLHAKKRQEIENYKWVELEQLQELAFSSGHKRILAKIQEGRHGYAG